MVNPPDRWTWLADKASQRYQTILQSFGNVYTQASTMPNPAAPSTLQWAAQNAYMLSGSYIEDEQDHINTTLNNEMQEALRSVASFDDYDDEINGHTDQLADQLQAALRVQLERDIETILKSLRVDSMQQTLARRKGTVVPVTSASPKFNYLDRAERNWPSKRFVRTLWRHALVLTYNDVSMLSMAQYGLNAVIANVDPDHPENGTIVTPVPVGNSISWAQVRDDVFHPNTNCWLEPSEES